MIHLPRPERWTLPFLALVFVGSGVVADSPAAPSVVVVSPATVRVAPVVQLTVRPDHPDWTYRVGEPVTFHVAVTTDRHPAGNVTVRYELGPELVGPFRTGDVAITAGAAEIAGGTLDHPGFLRCIVTCVVNGRTYRSLATAGFDPNTLVPTQIEPENFDAFWKEGREELAAVPIDAQVTPAPELSTPKYEAFHVAFRDVGTHLAMAKTAAPSRIHGVLCVPRGAGPFPAVLNLPGAGVRGYRGFAELAERGCITLQIGIHGIPVNLPAEAYQDLANGALADYRVVGADNRLTHYFRRVYLGCVRANDFLCSLPQWDKTNLIAFGGSQGGQLAIVTAALDARVTAVAALYPAYCDVTGFLHGRAGGWGHLFRPQPDGHASPHATPAKIAVSAIYDTVNFARRLRVPGFYSWGYNDEICPPTAAFAAYSVITAPKELVLFLETGHSVDPTQNELAYAWIVRHCRPKE